MTYQILTGDTLGAIAKKYNTDIPTLQKLNPSITDPNKIYAGASLNLPTPPTTTPPAGSLEYGNQLLEKGKALLAQAPSSISNPIPSTARAVPCLV